MPKLTLTQEIEIKPERFLNQCSPADLFEVWHLIQQKAYQDKIDLLLNGSVAAASEDVKYPTHLIVGLGGNKTQLKISQSGFLQADAPTVYNRIRLLICGIASDHSAQYVNQMIAGRKSRFINYRPNYDLNDFDLLEGITDIDFFVVLNLPSFALLSLVKFSTVGVPIVQPGKETKFITPHVIATTPASIETASGNRSIARRFELVTPE